tara:strand:+ start:8889 stop:9950 length:1062 start_codon:yes stop_codon:yes gene_type:complete
MDDFVISNLHESKNEWCSRLVSIFTPLVTEGIRSMFNEAWKICVDTDELGKYLMTFQNLLSRVPKWNAIIIEEERKRIIERSGCSYLEDLITCVHIIQLKVLTCIRVGNKQKQIDIAIPKLDNFIHKVYIHVARKIYTNVYLFEKNISPLQVQKHNRELEVIIQECILTAIRESIPTEEIIRAYMDESVEHEEEVVIENIEEPVIDEEKKEDGANDTKDTEEGEKTMEGGEEEKKEESVVEKFPEPKEEVIPDVVPTIKNVDEEPVITRLEFNDYDSVLEKDDSIETVSAPKTIERLETISTERNLQRKLDEMDDDDDEKLTIGTDIALDSLDITDMNKADDFVSLDDIVELN